MSVLGVTLDYGPFGFLNDYDAGFICNHSDRGGRYAFHRQPNIAHWNLHALAEALLPLITEDEAKEALAAYEPALVAHYRELMRAKLGLTEWMPEDGDLIIGLLEMMQANHVDYTNFFRLLGSFDSATDLDDTALRDLTLSRADFDAWAAQYRRRLQAEGSHDAERRGRMNHINPKFVLRNYLAQTAITLATEKRDFSEIARLLALLQDPFNEHPGMERYAAPPPDSGEHLVVSCSS
jgi:protein adenylyltransferase